jgi:hypothetical protein
MTTLEKSITQLDQTQRALRENLVTSWELLRKNEMALVTLKEAVKESLAGEQTEAKTEEKAEGIS